MIIADQLGSLSTYLLKDLGGFKVKVVSSPSTQICKSRIYGLVITLIETTSVNLVVPNLDSLVQLGTPG
jgi:hypothetical protein